MRWCATKTRSISLSQLSPTLWMTRLISHLPNIIYPIVFSNLSWSVDTSLSVLWILIPYQLHRRSCLFIDNRLWNIALNPERQSLWDTPLYRYYIVVLYLLILQVWYFFQSKLVKPNFGEIWTISMTLDLRNIVLHVRVSCNFYFDAMLRCNFLSTEDIYCRAYMVA